MTEIIKDFQWAEEMNCAVTVCAKDGTLLYMNKKSVDTFVKPGESMIGQNMLDCHQERSKQIIARLIETGGVNSYTITKNGVKKMIYQTAWKKNGEVMGLVEISMVIPEDMPHYDRDKK